MSQPLLQVNNLRTYFRTREGLALAVDGVNFYLERGETLALVGESGCGKSVTALSLMRLIPELAGEIVSGEIILNGKEVRQLSSKQMQAIRGKQIAMIFQEPMTAMNPVFTIGNQIVETIRRHQRLGFKSAKHKAIELLERVGIPLPSQRFDEYSYQLSGGMQQRAMIAMALSCQPDILIADEPTTALDVTIQAQILEQMKSLQNDFGMAILLITHDLNVVAEMADRVAVMYAGKIVETAPVSQLFEQPKHPYTNGLFDSLPSRAYRGKKLNTIPGMVPPATQFPNGCRFSTRCKQVIEQCHKTEPLLKTIGEKHKTACLLYE